MFKKAIALVALTVVALSAAPEAQNRPAAPKITSPKEQFGHDIGDDSFLGNYTQYVEYLKKLDAQSDRMTVVEIGKTEEGRPELTAIITSPENHRRLAQIKENNRKPARPRRRHRRRPGAGARARGEHRRLDRRRSARERGPRRATADRDNLPSEQ